MAAATRRRTMKVQAETPRTPAGPPAPPSLARIVEDLGFETLMACRRMAELRRELAECAGERIDPLDEATRLLRRMVEYRAAVHVHRVLLKYAEAVRLAAPEARHEAIEILRRRAEEILVRRTQDLHETSCTVTTGLRMVDAKAAGWAYGDGRAIIAPILDSHYLPAAGPATLSAAVQAALAIADGEAEPIVTPMQFFS